MNAFLLKSIRSAGRVVVGMLLAVLVAGCEHGTGRAFLNDTNIVLLTKANFAEQVLRSSEPVLVDYWAEWCGPCQALAPRVSELAAEYAGRIKFGKVDVDKEGALVDEYKVEAFPTLLFFKNGKEVDRLVGLREKAHLHEKLERLLAPSTPASAP